MSIPSHQKALLLPSKHRKFIVDTVEVYRPEAEEVLVRIETATLSHLDTGRQESGAYISSYPAIVGLDAAGVVVALGDNVTNLSLGDRVYVTFILITYSVLNFMIGFSLPILQTVLPPINSMLS